MDEDNEGAQGSKNKQNSKGSYVERVINCGS